MNDDKEGLRQASSVCSNCQAWFWLSMVVAIAGFAFLFIDTPPFMAGTIIGGGLISAGFAFHRWEAAAHEFERRGGGYRPTLWPPWL